MIDHEESAITADQSSRTVAARVSARTLAGFSAARAYAEFYSDPISCMRRLARVHGECVRIEHPFRPASAAPTYLLIGADWNKAVLTDASGFRPSGLWPVGGREGTALQQLRKNFLVQSGAEHAHFSKVAAPAFNRTRINAGYAELAEVAAGEIRAWPTGPQVDCSILARRLIQRLAFAGLFGEPRCDHALALGSRMDAFHKDQWSRSSQFFRFDLPGFRYSGLLAKARGVRAGLFDWLDTPWAETDIHNLRACVAAAHDPDGKPTSEVDKAAQIAGLLLASYETASATLAWALMFVALFPEHLEALRDEADRLFSEGASKEPVEDAGPLAEFIDETLRVCPPAPFLGFRVLQGTEIEGLDLEEGSTVFLSVLLTQRDPDIYDDPWSFRPERWRAISPNTYQFPAFSGGARRCPGFRFATNMLRHALAAVIANFDIEMPVNARFDYRYAAVMQPKGALALAISPRGAGKPPGSRPPLRGNISALIDNR